MKYLIVIPLIVLLALLFGLFLLPNKEEIAYLHLKGGELKKAETLYRQELTTRGAKKSLIAGLATVHYRQGDINQAIETIQQLSSSDLNELSTIEQLNHYYRQSNNPIQLLRHLEQKVDAAKRNSPKVYQQMLGEIARIHYLIGDEERYQQTLERLVNQTKPSQKTYQALASQYAASDKRQQAIDVLNQLQAQYPKSIRYNNVLFLANLLLDSNQQQPAIDIATQRIHDTNDPQETIGLSYLIYQKVGASAAQVLIDQLPQRSQNLAAIVLLQQNINFASGQDIEHYRHAKQQFEAGLASNTPVGLLFAKAVQRHDYPLAINILLSEAIEQFTEMDISATLKAAKNTLPEEKLHRLNQRVAQSLAAFPPLQSAQLAYLAQRPELAREQLQQVSLANSAPFEQQLKLATLNLALGQEQPLAPLRQINPATLTTGQLSQYARLTKKAGEAELLVATLNPTQHPKRVDIHYHWLLALFVEKQRQPALDWLTTQQAWPFDETQSTQLYNGAEQSSLPAITVVLATQLADQFGGQQNQLRLANAQLHNHQYSQALATLKPLRDSSSAMEKHYLDALYQARGAGLPVKQSLAEALLKQLSYQELDDDTQYRYLEDLVALGKAADVTPQLAKKAKSLDSRWQILYRRAIIESGDKKKTVAYLKKYGSQPGLTEKQRRTTAYELLLQGEKQSAEQLFMSLAANQTVDSSDTQQLLFLWGPRPTANAIEWLTSRARKAKPEERLDWIQLIVDKQAISQAVSLMEFFGADRSPQQPVFDLYLRTIIEQGSRFKLRRTLQVAIKTLTDSSKLEKLAAIAEQQHLSQLAGAGYQKVIEQKPDSLAALAFLSRLYVGRNNHQKAKPLLQRYLKIKEQAEPHFWLAEIFDQEQQSKQANSHYEQSIALIDRKKQPSLQELQIKATSLLRLNQQDKALALFDLLYKKQPNDSNIKADYVSLLMDLGQLAKAQSILEQN